MNFLRRDAVCSLLKLSPQQGYRIIGATEYGARISSANVIEMLNRARVNLPQILGDGSESIPSDLVTAEEVAANDDIAKSGISQGEILRWSCRRRNPLPHYRINRKTRLYRMPLVIGWLNARSPRKD